MKNPTKALFFDFDGVLADTFELCYQIIKTIDPALTREEYRDRFIGNINDHKSGKEIRKRTDFDFMALYTPELLKLKMNAGIKNTVLALLKNHSLFIVSSTDTDPIEKFLKQNKIDHCFKEIYGNDIHKSKIEKIKMILEKYSLAPSDCLFITDTLGDILEAKKCEVGAIAVLWGFHSRKTLRKGNPTIIVDSISELIDAI